MAGRPTKYKPEYCKQVEKLCKLGATDAEIAEFFEVNEDTFYEWMEINPAFAEVVNRRGELMVLREHALEEKRRLRREYRQLAHIKKQQNVYVKAKLKTDARYRVRFNFSSLLRGRLKTKIKGTFSSLGYSVADLMAHLESLFVDGMTWDNYGSVWHIDHKKPNKLFNYTSIEDDDFKQCWALSNLQPLFAMDNIKKGGKYASA